jgi:DNA-binding transcriptional MerR regulator
MILAWSALHCPYPGRKIKQSAIQVVKRAAKGDYGGALTLAYAHSVVVQSEKAQANAAASYLERWVQSRVTDLTTVPLKIGEVASLLDVSRDMLRNWENNGLLEVPRASNGYRQYGVEEIGRLRVIRMLVRSGYSMMAILRMLLTLDQGANTDLREVLDTPRKDEDIFTAADQWISTLARQEERADKIIAILHEMIEKYGEEYHLPTGESR